MSEQIETSRNLPPRRGMAKKSIALLAAMTAIVEAAQPITGRGVGYKLFVKKLIASMKTNDMGRVYRLLREARERGLIPWEWIVDESRQLEKTATWSDPEDYKRTMINAYRREYWDQQPVRLQVWSEKGTVRGVLQPVLDEYGIGFRVVHGFASATVVHNCGAASRRQSRSISSRWRGNVARSPKLPRAIVGSGGRQMVVPASNQRHSDHASSDPRRS